MRVPVRGGVEAVAVGVRVCVRGGVVVGVGGEGGGHGWVGAWRGI